MWFFQRKTIRTVFFDVGGVIVDAPMSHYEDIGCEVFSCKKEDLKLCSAGLVPLLETGKLSSIEFWERLGQALAARGLGQVVPGWRFKGLWESILLDRLRIDQEMLEIAISIRSKARVSILSNTIPEHALILKEHGVYERFNPVILSCQVGMRKPDINIYKEAARLTNCNPAGCLLIDDLLENTDAAEKAGFQAIRYQGKVQELRLQLHQRQLL